MKELQSQDDITSILSYLDDDELENLLSSKEEESIDNTNTRVSNLDSIIDEIRRNDRILDELRAAREALEKDLGPDIYTDLDDELLDLDF